MSSVVQRRRARTVTIDARKITHSGIGRYLRNILPGVLPRLRADRIVLLGAGEELAEVAGSDPRCSMWQSEAAPHSLAEQWLALGAQMRRTDLLWVPHYNLPLLYRGPLVTTLHDLAPLDLPESFDYPLKRMLASYLLRQSASRSLAILTPSRFSQQRIAKVLGVPPSRVHVTPLAVDRAWPSCAGAPVAAAVERPYLLFVGNLKPNKNLSTVVRAMELPGAGLAVNLVIAGKMGGFRTRDDAAAETAKRLGDRVHFTGAVPDAELIALYRGAAMLVLPSLYEGFGLPVLEAMRYGCPVVASNMTSLPEVAGNAALLVDPRDPVALAAAIRRALEPSFAEEMRAAGFAHERSFTYETAIERTADVLNAALGAIA